MPPNYDLQTYWQTRFGGEEHFEWLGDGSDTVLPHIRTYLLDSLSRTSAPSSPSQPPRLLHIGAGTSSLSKRIGQMYQEVYGADVDKSAIVHTDFAKNLVARMQQEGQEGGGDGDGGMRWVCVDVLRWANLKTALRGDDGDACTYDLVVDKSTSDAIACGGDISYTNSSPSLHPVFHDHLKAQESSQIDVAPIQVLAVHLASLVRPGGLWIALTYSSNRFAFLSTGNDAEGSQDGGRYAAAYWELERVVEVDAPSGMEGRGHAPAIQHYVFLLRRRRD